MSYKIFLDGGAGTTGLQIADILAACNDIEILVLGEEERKQTVARKAAMAEADITILCLPDEAAIEAVQMAAELQGDIRRDIRLIDASSAHRIHADFVYGFAEMLLGRQQKLPMLQAEQSGLLSDRIYRTGSPVDRGWVNRA